jgi:RimJ/RimL family protein N-acetyltransferase
MLTFRGVTVRQITADDIETVYDLIKNDEDRNLYIGGSFNLSLEEFIEFLLFTEYGTSSLPTIIEKDEPIGVAIINNISEFKKSANFRILALSREHRKSGYGFYAGAMIGAYLFGEMRLNKVYAGTWTHNPNMEEIYEWAGFRLEGTERQHAKINGQWVDRKLWGLLRSEVPEKLEQIFARIANENTTKERRDIPA